MTGRTSRSELNPSSASSLELRATVVPVEISQVTPPVGFNLFVLQNMTGRHGNLIARAALSFFLCVLVCIAIVTAFPNIVTWLPNRITGVPQ
jgi:TRAP-type C4-dicarboxylate transport system permease large subunit